MDEREIILYNDICLFTAGSIWLGEGRKSGMYRLAEIMTLIYYLMLMNDKGPKLREYKPGENAGADFSDFDREKNSDPFTQNIGDDNPFNRTHGTSEQL